MSLYDDPALDDMVDPQPIVNDDLPESTPRPCNDCPWRRVSAPGWLGPYDADEWVALVHSDEPIACHETIVEDEEWGGAKQCRGAATYRANVCKSPRDPSVAVGPVDREHVFASPVEFKAHHDA